MGIATQRLAWPATAPVPNLPAALAGDTSSASYTLSDLAGRYGAPQAIHSPSCWRSARVGLGSSSGI